MEFILNFLQSFWELSVMIGLYVLIGLIFVGIIHLYISEDWIKKHLGEDNKYSALKGALYGIPLPLCSCGVIPLATSLRQKGASKKAVTSFYITTPMTGIDSIIATYGVFGLPVAIIRVISSFISGVVAGSFVKESYDDIQEEEKKSCCSSSCCGSSSNEVVKESQFKKAYDYAMNEVFSDLAKPMFYGLILATLFLLLIPNNGVEFLNDNLFIAYALVFLVALPLYVCSISAIPIALSMLAVGVSPGVAFIFLAAAPATNIITAGIIKKILGNDVLIIYLISIIVVTVSFALMIDFAFPKEWFVYTLDSLESESKSILDIGGAIIFLVTMFYFVGKQWIKSISSKKN
ncbi:hypothetical protein CRV03_02525 [Arcobacter sp. F155]|uniref:permease n=1 Tax=Arcobacter sp. F155 TaxID=2044512 RepID=UPI00100B8B8B|nr:permease [Arcobacter sp. F155]RXJ77865.1 hypothetical protein CRV03_02525 [Arcobacter sp. F155]